MATTYHPQTVAELQAGSANGILATRDVDAAPGGRR